MKNNFSKFFKDIMKVFKENIIKLHQTKELKYKIKKN